MAQAVNPYLPQGEYVPDGEPHLFGDRVYVYGSHDLANAPYFCLGDYVCWSAPANDLGDWRYEGVIFHKNQDPKNRLGLRLLFAPDVVKGTDGRYYLFYAFDFMGMIGVAVCDEPAGAYQYLGHVSWPDGTPYGRRDGDGFPFDPGVLVDDDGRVYLYSGFYTPVPCFATGGKHLRFDGGYVLELEQDMHTIKGEERLLFPKEGPGSFPGHEFFEASSIRKVDDTYYFVYSSRVNHELCYATAPSPTGPFEYGGVLVSIADVGLDGITDENHARNYAGNTHGGLLCLGEGDERRFFVFYHRQTNRSSYSRQACAEELRLRPDGGFAQAEITSCGLNGGPLEGRGSFDARIACNLWAKGHATGRYDVSGAKRTLATHPYFTQDGRDDAPGAYQYVANMHDGSVAGFKYFDLQGITSVSVTVRGKGTGRFVIATSEDLSNVVASIELSDLYRRTWSRKSATASVEDGVHALYVGYEGDGAVDFRSLTLD